MSRKLRMFATVVMFGLIAAPLASSAPRSTSASSTSPTISFSLDGTTSSCPTPTPKQVFAPWGDADYYILGEGGSMEDTSKWAGGTFVADNDPFRLSGPGKKALRLLNGESASAPWGCQGGDYPTLRFVVRNVGNPSATLDVNMYLSGAVTPLTIATITAGSAWAPSPVISVPSSILPDGLAITSMRVGFTARGTGAEFRVDDLFIDPRSRA